MDTREGVSTIEKLNGFHDGYFNGLLIEDRNVKLFLSTLQQQHFVLDVKWVDSLQIEEVREGNIIFDILIRHGAAITMSSIKQLFGFSDEAKTAPKLEQVRNEGLILIELNSSYGASGLILARSANLLSRTQSATP